MVISYQSAEFCDIEPIFELSKRLIDDYEDISSIDYNAVLDWVNKKIQNNITEYTCVTVNGEKAGYYRLHPVGNEMEIDDLYVLPAFRNQGVGTQIIKKCLSQTKCNVFLYVFTKNVDAIRFYKRFGFETVKKVSNTRIVMKIAQVTT